MPVASLTSFVGDHGVYAIFGLMLAAGIVPAASEVVMIYGGALASGAFASHVLLFGHAITTPAWGFVTVALTGLIGNLIGAAAGWAIGRYGGRRLIERHGRWLHVSPARLARAEQRFERYENEAVAIGFAIPGVRSFVAIPAGTMRVPLVRFLPLAALGCAAFCFGLAGAGWALGKSWNSLHHDFRYVYIGIGVLVIAIVAVAVLRYRSKLARRAPDTAR